MTDAAALWDQFVAAASADTAALVAAAGDPAGLAGNGQRAFRIALSSLLLGAEDVGRLALAIERAIDREAPAGGEIAPELPAAIAALHAALVQLAGADRSGARVEGLALDDHRRALDAGDPDPSGLQRPAGGPSGPDAAPFAIPDAAFAPAPSAPRPAAVDTGGGFAWSPSVDDDMVELFFDEATERIAALAGKLIEIERRPGDAELVRDVFRDLHTVKGSSAMVGLQPVNQLAHAAEDLVGQIRDAGREVDGPVIDALLAALDALRDMLAEARAGRGVALDPAPVVARLRNPAAPPPPAPAAAEAALAAAAPRAALVADPARQTIRVDFDKLDRLLNLVGELVLGRDGLRGAVHALGSVASELAADRGIARRAARTRAAAGAATRHAPAGRGLDQLGDELSRIERVLADVAGDLDRGTDRLDAISDELRDQVMRLRMVSVAGVFRKHVRTVRDLATGLGKRARLELDGEDTELDKLLVEALDEPLLHLVRNAVDHGVEPPDARAAAGKPAEGVIRIAAAHRGNQVEIRVTDDGRGLDPDRLRAKAVERGVVSPAQAQAMDDRTARELIFRAGFSTAAQVSEVSGRGVGMDAVRQTIVTRLKGTIDVHSTPGQGSEFVLKLPLTLAIIQVIVARAGGETFAIPLDVVKRVLVIEPGAIQLIGDREVCVVRGRHVPVIRLDAVLELDGGSDGALQLVLVDAGPGREAYALVCDHLIGKREIVIKSLGPLLANVPCAAGATLLGDRVALILDVPAIIRRALERPAARPERTAPRSAQPDARGAHILLVEDSDTVRESLRRLLADAGYLVTVAVDGQHGLELARTRRFDLISTDVVMPRLDGYELTRALRAMPEYADAPIVMVTSMGERIDRVRGFDAGVDEYITKPHDRALLLRVVDKLLGRARARRPGGGVNVVLVSDEPVLAELTRRPLEPLGFTVTQVASIAELERRLAELAPRAVLLPRRLPDRPLGAAIELLRRAGEPIAAVVVGVQPADRRLARDVDADGFLLVPFSDAEVLDVLGATTRARKLILLADDSPLIHRHTVPLLEDEGYEVRSAADGAEAIALARALGPDLVITDVEMPGIDGYGVCKALKSDPATARVPVLICSSLGEAADLERGFDAGADDYLVKPVLPEELSTRVRALVLGSLPASRERILVVDDSPAQRHYVADCLARQGFEITTADNGRTALDKAQASRPALVVSDYEMPVMTGFELVHALRRDPELRQIPVIMLTARDSRRDMAQMRAAGASAYLVKPFSQDKCIALVERTLAERRLIAYKEASALFISAGARAAAEDRAARGEALALRADERTVSVLFSDLVGFTPMSAALAPAELIALLNDYFDVMCPILVAHGGDIDKFIGDAIMAVFDEVRGKPPSAERAVRAGLAMQAAMPAFNRGRSPALAMRIGINTGPVVRGDLGARVVRRDYTVIGDTVNHANRYESRCPPGGVLVSASTRAALGGGARVTELPGLELKGIAAPVTGYLVHGLEDA